MMDALRAATLAGMDFAIQVWNARNSAMGRTADIGLYMVKWRGHVEVSEVDI